MTDIVRKVETVESPPRTSGDGARREIVITIEAETLERQQKLARVRAGQGSTFEVLCDEGKHLGGDDEAPSPLAYFSAGVAF